MYCQQVCGYRQLYAQRLTSRATLQGRHLTHNQKIDVPGSILNRDRRQNGKISKVQKIQCVAAPEKPSTQTQTKRVYVFGPSISEGNQSQKKLLGGKGAGLAEMCRIGLSVPPGITITTETCQAFHDSGSQLPDGCWEEIISGLTKVEEISGKKLGDKSNPLLVSVRSGAAVSMPGMMDTVLNLGLNDEVVEGLALKSNERFAYDSYRRFLDMYGGVVIGISHKQFEHEFEKLKEKKHYKLDTEMTAQDLKDLVQLYKQVYKRNGLEFPQDPLQQLEKAIYAVFNSWQSDRAVAYRQINSIGGLVGTAVNVQTMAFGNMGDTSGTGVLFTRNPATGENKILGEYLVNAQGEDVVAGIRTPETIQTLADIDPAAYEQLTKNCEILEQHYKDMQDMEFTVEDHKLYILQCRSGKRTGAAALKIALDFVNEGLIDIPRAINLVDAHHLDSLLHPQFQDADAYASNVLTTGLPASPGAAVGRVAFNAEDVGTMVEAGEKVILLRKETSPEDVKGMYSSEAVVTALGGMTSHAAVVARGWGKPCVCGCQDIMVDEDNKVARLGQTQIREGDWLSVNGSTGEVIRGQQPLKPAEMSGGLAQFMEWVEGYKQLGVLTNADTPEDADTARANGAQGIGLCRTEHMFFKTEDRIKAVRKMILASNLEDRKKALVTIQQFQQEDFEGIYKAMTGLPVTIRLLDPPLHEFLPPITDQNTILELSNELGIPPETIVNRIESLEELNPMLGFRGCRLTITYPEIAEAQVTAVIQGALNAKKNGVDAIPEIMIPLVGTIREMEISEKLVRSVADKLIKDAGSDLKYKVGTMIETPRGAIIAGQLAAKSEFFSFGTNDLTQMTFGYSRDDIGKFVTGYLQKGILQYDPFQVVDQEGVGFLIQHTVTEGRKTRPDIKIGICGEQGGEPHTVKFLHNMGLNYVSCSPFRVPIARLAAAQAAIENPRK